MSASISQPDCSWEMRCSSPSLNPGGPCTTFLPCPSPQPASDVLALFHLPRFTTGASKGLWPQLSRGLLWSPWLPAQHQRSIAGDLRLYWQPASQESIPINPPCKTDDLRPSHRPKPTNPSERDTQAWLPVRSVQPHPERCSGSHGGAARVAEIPGEGPGCVPLGWGGAKGPAAPQTPED